MRLWVSAGGAVSPLHYDAAGSFLAQAIILTMAICLTTQATILTMAVYSPWFRPRAAPAAPMFPGYHPIGARDEAAPPLPALGHGCALPLPVGPPAASAQSRRPVRAARAHRRALPALHGRGLACGARGDAGGRRRALPPSGLVAPRGDLQPALLLRRLPLRVRAGCIMVFCVSFPRSPRQSHFYLRFLPSVQCPKLQSTVSHRARGLPLYAELSVQRRGSPTHSISVRRSGVAF